jgi:Tfp pilus assembly protein PilX
MRTGARRVSSDQRGIALVVVMSVLAFLILLGGAVFTSAIQGDRGSTSQRSRVRALAAAQTGLDVAIYRLNRMSTVLADTQCLAGSGGVVPSTLTWCAAVDSTSTPPSLANRASYKYWTSSVLSTGAHCGLTSVIFSTTEHERCIVALGSAGGKSRRIVELLKGIPRVVQPVAGILSYGNLTASGTMNVTGDIGSGGTISLPTNTNITGKTEYVPPNTVTCNANPQSKCGTQTAEPATTFVPPPPNPVPFAASQLSNNNANIVWKDSNCNTLTGSSSPYVNTGSVPRQLGNAPAGSAFPNQIGSSSSTPQCLITIPSGTYNFCNVNFSNKLNLQIPLNAQVTIYIDSPARAGSLCPSGTGNFSLSNSVLWLNPNSDPGSLQIIAYGDPTNISNSTFKISNSVNSVSQPFAADIVAPYSTFTTSNVLSMTGLLQVGSFLASNTVNFTEAGGTGPTGSQVAWSRDRASGGWLECPPVSSPNPPDSGC